MKRFASILLVLVVLAALAAAGFLVVSRSDFVLAWALERIAAASGGRLAFEGVRGDLAGRPSVASLRYRDADVDVIAREVQLSWSPLLLAAGRLEIASLAAAEVDVTTVPSDTPATLPDTLALPLHVRIAEVAVPKIVLRRGDTVTTFEQVRLAYRGDGTQHRVDALSGRVLGASITASATMGAAPPYPIAGAAKVDFPEPPVPVTAEAKLGGTLSALTIDAHARGKGFSSASGTASLTPFGDRWLEAAKWRVEDLDIAALQPGAPRTRIALDATAALDADETFVGSLAARNTAPGPVDRELLPITTANARYRLVIEGRLVLEELVAEAPGGGRATGTARIGERVELALAVRDIDLATIWSTLTRTSLAGRIDVTIDADGERVDANVAENGIELALQGRRRGDELTAERFKLRARGGSAAGRGGLSLAAPRRFDADLRLERFDPSAFGDFPRATLTGRVAAQGRIEKPWSVTARTELQRSRFRDLALSGGGTATVTADRIEGADLAVTWGSTRATAKGALGRDADALALTFDARNLGELDQRFAGRVAGTARLRGALRSPAVDAEARGDALGFPDGAAGEIEASASFVVDLDAPLRIARTAPLALDMRTERLAARGIAADRARLRIDGALAAHRVDLEATGQDFDLATRIEGGVDAKTAWAGTVTRLENRGRFPAMLKTPAAVELAPGRAAVGPFEAAALGGTLQLRDSKWEAGRLTSSGAFTSVPAKVLMDAAGAGQDVRSTLVLAGDWSLVATPRLNGTVRLRRESGDIDVLSDPVFPLGLEQLEVEARIVDDRLDAVARARGTGIGELTGRALVMPVAAQDGVRLTLDSPLEATLDASAPSLKPFTALVGSTVLLGGSLQASLQARGTVRRLLVTGNLAADRLQLLMPAQGVDWSDGRLRAQLTPTGLEVSDFAVRAGSGTFTAKGRLPRNRIEGEARLEWRADRFLALARPDRRLVVSGEGTTAFDGKRIALRGRLTADEGNFEFGRSELPTLGDDVVIVGEQRRAPGAFDVPVALDLAVDFGEKLRVSGYGLETLLGGQLKVGTTGSGQPTASGVVVMRRGTYRAYGQNLRIEQGRLTFDGPIENPALQVTAWRRNQAVEAGVEVTGSVRNPRVRIVSEPPVPEGEALSWLVLGRGPELGNRSDLAALQVAAAALAARSGDQPITRQIARSIGLDDISINTVAVPGGTTSSAGTLSTNVIAFGKRLSDRLYLVYEQAIAGTGSVVKLDYLLTRSVSLRAEAGTRTGASINYRYSFD
jgi:translocation and assembly module TamB